MDYGKVTTNSNLEEEVKEAPKTYVKSNGETIMNFNKNEPTMKEYGFKEVTRTVPSYDPMYESLYVDEINEEEDDIEVLYAVNTDSYPPYYHVDLSNYYTKQQVYNKVEIDEKFYSLDIGDMIYDHLQVVNLEVEDLKAQFASIDTASINKLYAVFADIEKLKADVAEIGDLTVVNAKIEHLEANYAEIKVLVNGHLTSDNIHSMIISGDKFTVVDGFIKNAMIESLNAKKINAGILNTNNVVIQSDDGGMLLQGNLQQFKDKDGNVRIQIGKDASGDFTFALYGADGRGQLINQDGIKPSAVSDGLIVDAMINDNANISGGKLDIDSLFTEMNGSENTLKASKIKFDDKNQTLEVAFNQLVTKVETLGDIGEGDLGDLVETVTSNTTRLDVQQGQIEGLISVTTITKEDGTVSSIKDAYNSIKDDVDSHRQTIAEFTTKIDGTLTSTRTQWYSSTSNTELKGGTWSNEPLPWENEKYLWQRQVYVYSNGKEVYGSHVCISGAKGDKGDQGLQGIPGQKGEDGTSVKILGNYSSEDELNQAHPTGNENGDGYIINGDLYVWNGSNFTNVGQIKGEQGETSYVHIKYSNDGVKFTSNNGETVGSWIGIYADFNREDSNNFSDYSWKKIEGEQGIPGESGKTSYFHIKYSSVENPNPNDLTDVPSTYIGTYVDFNELDSNDPSSYTWSRFEGIQGERGEQGIPGVGEDGKTSYLHIAYANSSDGSVGFSVTDGEGKSYIGQYVDFEVNDSTQPNRYTWSKIQGEQGIPGIPGEPGTSYYTWVKYASDSNGTNMSDYPDGKEYIGLAHNKITPNESSNPLDYKWSKFKGDQGIQGEKGDDGQPKYTWIKYADSATGEGISDNPDGKSYMGIAYNKDVSSESTNPYDYMWSKIKGEQGAQGIQGIQGEKGDQGVPGPKGEDGTSVKILGTYNSVEELNQAHPNNNEHGDGYIIKGELYIWNGTSFQNVGQIKGEAGDSAYIHIKYSNDGETFTSNNGEDIGEWMGVYTDSNEQDSSNFSDYRWSKIKGDQGLQGKTSYFHIKYSNVANPTSSSEMTETPSTYIGTYVDFEVNDSNDPTKYKWSRFEGIQGEKGEQGIPGIGKDGKTSYLHVKYSDDNGRTFTSNNGEDVGLYIGTCVDFNVYDPVSTSSYTWAKIKGEDGNDGISQYFHIKYSDSPNPTLSSEMSEYPSTYIGTYVDDVELDSNDPTKYKWARFQGLQGEKGEQGVPGVGKDGKTSYLHVKYSDDGGQSFTNNNGETVGSWIGTCVNFEVNDPILTSAYTWAKIKGDQGQQGLQGLQGEKGDQGVPGNGIVIYTTNLSYTQAQLDKYNTGTYINVWNVNENTSYSKIGDTVGITVKNTTKDSKSIIYGTILSIPSTTSLNVSSKSLVETGGQGDSTYFHIKYSSVANPTLSSQMTETPSEYIGTYVDFIPTDSTNPSSYKWARFQGLQGEKGEQGIPGVGEDGNTTYLHIKYSNDGVEFTSNNGETVGEWIGTCTDFNEDDPTTFNSYKWVKIKGEQGIQGIQGEQGIPGAPGNSVKVFTTNYRYSQAEINQYSDTTYSGTWKVNENTSDVKVGDTVGVSMLNTTKNVTSIIYGEVISVPSSTSIELLSKSLVESGGQGDKGQSLIKSTPQWYLSSSSTTQYGGSWVESMPALNLEKWLWMRYKLEWANPTATTYTVPTIERISEQVKIVEGRMSTMEQDLSGFKTTVSNTYASKDDLVNLEVGGANLVMNSSFKKGTDCWTLQEGVTLDESKTYMGNPSIKSSQRGLTSYQWRGAYNTNVPNAETEYRGGDVYTASCWYYVESNHGIDEGIALELDGNELNGTPRVLIDASVSVDKLVVGKWTRINKSIKLPYDVRDVCIKAFVKKNGTAWFTCFKLEKGSVVSDWSDSPLEIRTDITEIKQTADKISWLVRGGSSSSNMELTNDALTVIANNINLKGKVTADWIQSDAINGMVITGNTIIGATIRNTDSTFVVDSSGNVTGANITGSTVKGTTIIGSVIKNEDGTFNVDELGNIYGATITTSNFSSGDGSFNMSTDGLIKGATIVGSNIRNAENIMGATFMVDPDGEVNAENIYVSNSVSTSTLICEDIDSESYPKALANSVFVQVSSTDGTDDVELEQGALFQSIQGVLNKIPKNMNGKTVQIELLTNTTENIKAHYFTNGRLDIFLYQHTIYGSISCFMNTARVRIYGGSQGSPTGFTGVVHPSTPLNFNSRSTSIGCDAAYTFLYNLKVYGGDSLAGSTTARTAVGSQGNSVVYCSDIEVLNCDQGFRANTMGRMHVNKSVGMAKQYGFAATSGGILTVANNTQAGGVTKAYDFGSGGQVIFEKPTWQTGTASSDTTVAPSTSSTTEVITIKPTSADTYRSTVYNNWKNDGTVREGNWGYGNCNGMWFYGSNFEDVKGKTITKVVITIKRLTGGSFGAVTHTLKAHNFTSKSKVTFSSGVPNYNSWSQTFSLAVGSSTSVTITDTAVLNGISNGTIKGFGLKSPYSSGYYSVCSGGATVKIYYK